MKVKIDFVTGELYTQTSRFEDQRLLFDAASTTTYGILFHEDAFIFGITDSIYAKQLTGKAGFLMNTDKYRLTDYLETE